MGGAERAAAGRPADTHARRSGRWPVRRVGETRIEIVRLEASRIDETAVPGRNATPVAEVIVDGNTYVSQSFGWRVT